jgi:hypothetical protein
MKKRGQLNSRSTNISDEPEIKCKYFKEPLLRFAAGKEHVDPKTGLARFGPLSLDPLKRHPDRVRIGLVGTSETVEKAEQWISINAKGVPGDEKHPDFPGCASDRGFHTALEFSRDWTEQITQTELQDILQVRQRREKFEKLLLLLEQKFRLLDRKDLKPDYVVLTLPENLAEKVFSINYHEEGLGTIHRDLRRAIKARVMKYKMPTQLVDQKTIEFRDPDNPAKIAWNFFTGLYFKAGGIPWGPTGLAPGTCYMGVKFYRGLGTTNPAMFTSLVQAFDEHGEGLVFRGPDFEWNPLAHESKTPHLKAEDAYKLVKLALAKYSLEMKQLPSRVVIHKSSRWTGDEKAGVREGLRDKVGRYDLVALQRQDSVRLITASKYPPLRGTRFTVGELDFLYTTGFVPELGQFHGMHVPSPLLIADHVGSDTPRETLIEEILTLTKMNWNAARLGGLLPITLEFARRVSDIMKEIPPNEEPLPQAKFYN